MICLEYVVYIGFPVYRDYATSVITLVFRHQRAEKNAIWAAFISVRTEQIPQNFL